MQRQTGLLQIDRVLDGRRLSRLARRMEVLDTTSSTNDVAFGWMNERDPDGHVAFAEQQSSGRGRMGRRWQSPRGASVICSILLVDSDVSPLPTADALALIGGIATVDAILQSTGISATVVWPNDVYIGERKVAGVLVESRTRADGRRAYAVGIGINCLQQAGHWTEDLRARATSLYIVSRAPVDRESVAGTLLANLDAWLGDSQRWSPHHIREHYRRCASPIGRLIRLRSDGETHAGQVIDIDPAEGLVVQLDGGERRVFPAASTTVLAPDSLRSPLE